MAVLRSGWSPTGTADATGWHDRVVETILDRLVPVYGAAADPERAAGMRAYMRDQFPFLGIPTAARRALSREVLAGAPTPTGDDLRAVALACWELPEREYQYFASDLLGRHARRLDPAFLDTVRYLVTTKSWWDTVDALASKVVGSIVDRHPETVATMDVWLVDENLWLARTAILHQLTYKERTDTARLFRYCLARADHKDFFIRKAIGWALRQYAWTDPVAVRRFVAAHATELSPLSVREATKNLS
jgi:3-methyladenine DNA glycosylase AlkD